MPDNTNDPNSDPTNKGGSGGGNAGTVEALRTQISELNSQVADWEKKYAGLQRTLNRRDDQIGDLQESLSAAEGNVESLTSKLKETSANLESLTKESGDFEAALQAKDATIAELNSTIERTSTVMKDFPDLVKFESDGLLPTAETAEELQEKLTAFQNNLKNIGNQTVDDFLNGEDPDGDGSNNNNGGDPESWKQDPDKVYERLEKIAGRKGHEEEEAELQVIWDGLNDEVED